MKKFLKIVLIVFLILAVVGIVVFIRLNREKESITTSKFIDIAEKKGLLVQDGTYQFYDYDYIKKATIAYEKDAKYQIEFYEFDDEEGANYFFNLNKALFEESKGNSSGETIAALKNYAKYTLSTNGEYMVISKIDNTAVYLKVNDEYKDTVKGILKEMGY